MTEIIISIQSALTSVRLITKLTLQNHSHQVNILIDSAQFMSIFKTLFSGGSSQGKTFKKACLDLELLPSDLADLTPYRCQLGGGLIYKGVKDKHGHKFCRECAEQRITAGVYCEVDKNNRHKLKKEQLTADTEGDFLSLRCPNSKQQSNPCPFKFIIKDYKDYLTHQNICPKTLITCTSPGCQGMIFREDLEEHLKSRCHYVTVSCQFCRMEMLRKDMKEHQAKCPDWPIKCPNEKCGNQMRRRMMKMHVETLCPYTEIKCPKMRCKHRFLRHFLDIHKEACQYADRMCQYCGKTYEKFDKQKHQNQCPQFPLRCTHQKCEEVLPRRQWDDHYKNTCPMKVIACPSEGCSVRFPQKQKQAHISVCPHHILYCEYCNLPIKRQQMIDHLGVCPEFPIQCKNLDKCNQIVKRGQHRAHLRDDCPYTTVPCQYYVNKCPQQFLRKDVEAHEKNCQYRPQPCRLCGLVMPLITIETHIIAECPEHTIPCAQQCEKMIVRRKMGEHIRVSCGQTVIGCEYEEYGCNHTFKRKDTETHLDKFINYHHTLILKLTFGLKKKVQELQEVQLVEVREIATIKQKVQLANNQLERVLEQQAKTMKQLKQAKDTIKQINGTTHETRNQTENAIRRIDGINRVLETQVRDIAGINKTLDKITKDIRQCNSNVNSVYSKVGSVESAVGRIPRV